MNKKLLVGLGLGLIAYYFLMKRGKSKCDCQDDLSLPTDFSDKRTSCEKQVEAGMSNIRFINAEAMVKYRDTAIKECMSGLSIADTKNKKK